MKHPLWKRWLSYFKEISLEQTYSQYNPFLEVLLVEGRHQLVTKDAIYSFDDKYINFDYAFKKTDWDSLSGNRVLILGLGLGSVILLMEKKYGLEMDYTAIEVDQEICRLCSKYTLNDVTSFVEILPMEAMAFMDTNQETYDLVIMDIFQSGDIPLKFQDATFLSKLKTKLKPNGLLLYNRLDITKEHQYQNQLFRTNIKKQYPDYGEIAIKDNIIFVNDNSFIL